MQPKKSKTMTLTSRSREGGCELQSLLSKLGVVGRKKLDQRSEVVVVWKKDEAPMW